MSKYYFVYLLTGKSNRTVYTGVINDLRKRIWQHKNKIVKGFSKKYNPNKLLYYEIFEDINLAIEREKQIKKYKRKKKENLINKMNREWKDIYNVKSGAIRHPIPIESGT